MCSTKSKSVISNVKLLSFFFVLFFPFVAEAATSYDTLSFKPTVDHGNYFTVEQSQTLGQWGYAIGVTGDFSADSLVLKNAAGVNVQDVVQKELALHFGLAFGLADWLNLGVEVSGAPYQEFVTPTTLAPETAHVMGDVLLNLKLRLLDNESSPIGLALVPFITFPTGSDSHFVGNGDVTGGGKLVLDTKRIGDRVSFALNAGTQIRKEVVLAPGATVIDDQFLYGAGVNIKVAKPVQLIAEVRGSTPFQDFFKSNNRDLEIDGGLRFLSGEEHQVALTVGGGAGLLRQVEAPKWRGFATLSYRFPQKEMEEESEIIVVPEVKEEVITTNEIHFALNKATIRDDSKSILDDILEQIKGRHEIERVRIEGHTDSTGAEAYNQQLSEQRANAVRTYFLEHGYSADKMTAVGMGENNPVADNATKDGRAQNRRVEFHLQIAPGANMRVEEK
ncbi:MAG: hypothetical protein COV43_06130 [Deltaproteobacteria bacterium CG11_big_fil_rev_8_21_14_0_20_42_23]|nr:MAG: hypothetical protein COV43_06130 [Deltaproteobacteria bacterium CG11_big_fil_rev_8_21_14_0_20_42_23]PJC65170.1 MAG: hypothetical protein CO021_00525 [Deltaproteobacteria bacterium CG_4_9_14_0_2_um_filter_42_21]